VVAGIDEFFRWVHPESWVHLFQDGLELFILREWDLKENTNFDGDNTFAEAYCYFINVLVVCHTP
jgi:hypothetical protein